MGIQRRGLNNKNSKITEETAKEIKIRLIDGEKCRDIANDLNISEKIVRHINYLETWQWVLPELNESLLTLIKRRK